MSRRNDNKLLARMSAQILVERVQAARRHAVRLANGTNAKPRPRCQCAAYPFPHRPAGGLCRYPDPPLQVHPGKPSTHSPMILRRGSAVRRRLTRRYGWHLIRDREKIRRWLPKVYIAWLRRHGWPAGYMWLAWDIPAIRATASLRMTIPWSMELQNYAQRNGTRWHDFRTRPRRRLRRAERAKSRASLADKQPVGPEESVALIGRQS